MSKNPRIKIEKINSSVIDIINQSDKFVIVQCDGSKVEANNLFIFSGIGSKFLPVNFLREAKLIETKHLMEGFLVLKKCSNADAFILSQDKINIIFDGNSTVQTNIQPGDSNSLIASIFEKQFEAFI